MYIIVDESAGGAIWYVESLPGWTRAKDGTYYRDGSLDGGPGWTRNVKNAYVFKTHRAAARVRNRERGRIVEASNSGR